MFILTDFKKWWSDVSFPIPVATIILRLRKVKFETKHDQFCVWLILAQLAADWECSHIFSESFSQKRTCFVLLLPAFCTCSMLWEDFFLPNHLKFNLNSQNFLPFYNAEGKTLEWWCQLCVCPLIDHRQKRKKLIKELLSKRKFFIIYNICSLHHLHHGMETGISSGLIGYLAHMQSYPYIVYTCIGQTFNRSQVKTNQNASII